MRNGARAVTPDLTILNGTNTHIDAAAQIWAEATAKRDGDQDVAPLSMSRPVIQRALGSSQGSFLLIAVDQTRSPVGMALLSASKTSNDCAELHYFAVSPTAWGRGVGKFLLEKTALELLERRFKTAELEVYENNRSAVELYRNHGWSELRENLVHKETGKRLLRFSLDLTGDELKIERDS